MANNNSKNIVKASLTSAASTSTKGNSSKRGTRTTAKPSNVPPTLTPSSNADVFASSFMANQPSSFLFPPETNVDQSSASVSNAVPNIVLNLPFGNAPSATSANNAPSVPILDEIKRITLDIHQQTTSIFNVLQQQVAPTLVKTLEETKSIHADSKQDALDQAEWNSEQNAYRSRLVEALERIVGSGANNGGGGNGQNSYALGYADGSKENGNPAKDDSGSLFSMFKNMAIGAIGLFSVSKLWGMLKPTKTKEASIERLKNNDGRQRDSVRDEILENDTLKEIKDGRTTRNRRTSKETISKQRNTSKSRKSLAKTPTGSSLIMPTIEGGLLGGFLGYSEAQSQGLEGDDMSKSITKGALAFGALAALSSKMAKTVNRVPIVGKFIGKTPIGAALIWALQFGIDKYNKIETDEALTRATVSALTGMTGDLQEVSDQYHKKVARYNGVKAMQRGIASSGGEISRLASNAIATIFMDNPILDKIVEPEGNKRLKRYAKNLRAFSQTIPSFVNKQISEYIASNDFLSNYYFGKDSLESKTRRNDAYEQDMAGFTFDLNDKENSDQYSDPLGAKKKFYDWIRDESSKSSEIMSWIKYANWERANKKMTIFDSSAYQRRISHALSSLYHRGYDPKDLSALSDIQDSNAINDLSDAARRRIPEPMSIPVNRPIIVPVPTPTPAPSTQPSSNASADGLNLGLSVRSMDSTLEQVLRNSYNSVITAA